MRWAVACILLVALASVGCQKRQTGASASDYQKRRTALLQKQKEHGARVAPRTQSAATSGSDGSFGAVGADYSYDRTGKRDPFRSFVLDRLKQLDETTKGPLEQFDLSQLDVVGVVWDASNRRALVQDPSGRGYIVKEGTRIGKNEGRIIRIDDNLVLVRETYVDYIGEKTTKDISMRVRQAQGG